MARGHQRFEDARRFGGVTRVDRLRCDPSGGGIPVGLAAVNGWRHGSTDCHGRADDREEEPGDDMPAMGRASLRLMPHKVSLFPARLRRIHSHHRSPMIVLPWFPHPRPLLASRADRTKRSETFHWSKLIRLFCGENSRAKKSGRI
ncbi:hypothetical protein [Sphingopyxis sp. C-1]|nr:hypothetical protein [Sphingopyxis sp. C-1]